LRFERRRIELGRVGLGSTKVGGESVQMGVDDFVLLGLRREVELPIQEREDNFLCSIISSILVQGRKNKSAPSELW
jgi:hypothetical protein